MAAVHGFQLNTTITAAFWRYIPDPAITPPSNEIYVSLENLQRVECLPNHTKVWLYYAQRSLATTQEPSILEGDAAVQFMADFGGLF